MIPKKKMAGEKLRPHWEVQSVRWLITVNWIAPEGAVVNCKSIANGNCDIHVPVRPVDGARFAVAKNISRFSYALQKQRNVQYSPMVQMMVVPHWLPRAMGATKKRFC